MLISVAVMVAAERTNPEQNRNYYDFIFFEKNINNL